MNDLRISWDQVDIELCTVTFSGLAKPHCLVCSSQSFLPVLQEQPCLLSFQQIIWVQLTLLPLPARVPLHVPAVSPKVAITPTDPPTQAIAARNKVQLQAKSLDPPVFRMMMQIVLVLLPTLYTHPWTVLLSATPRMASVPSLTFFWAWGIHGSHVSVMV